MLPCLIIISFHMNAAITGKLPPILPIPWRNELCIIFPTFHHLALSCPVSHPQSIYTDSDSIY